MKRILRKINPLQFIELPIKRRIVRYAIGVLKNWVRRRVTYHPLQNYLVRLLKRVEVLVPLYIASDNRSEVFRNYWQSDRVGIINDQVAMLQALAEAEIRDAELAQIINETVSKLEAWKVKRLQVR